MEKTYYIYHIPGRKYGCTQNYPARPASQSDIYELTEVHTDIMIASKREKELNIAAQYPWTDSQYYWMQVRNGRISGQKHVESGHILELGRIYGPINAKILGKKYGGKYLPIKTKEHQSKAARAAGKISMSVERTCPHCYKTIKGMIYFRYHGDNCKQIKSDTYSK